MLLYSFVNNYGLALILFAIVIRVILLPFQMKSKLGIMRQTRLQPRVEEIQKKHGTNKAKANEEMAKMYKEEGVNPASGCLWGFLPLPIMFALFLVIREPLTMMMSVPAELLVEGGAISNVLHATGFENWLTDYYVQIAQAQWISDPSRFEHFAMLSENLRRIDFTFLGLNLGEQPRWNFLWTTNWGDSSIWVSGFILFLLPLLSAGSQYLSTAINKKVNPAGTPEGQGGSMKIMMTLMPLMSVYFGFIVPAALSLYWMVGTLLQIIQDVILTKRYTRKLDAEDVVKNEERIKKEAEIEAKRLESERKKAEGLIERNPNTSKRKKQKSSKQEQIDKAAQWEKINSPIDEKYEPSRVGDRRYARGRAYDPDRYTMSATDLAGADDNESERGTQHPELSDEDESKSLLPGSEEDDDTIGDTEGGYESDAGTDIGDDQDALSSIKFDTTRFDEDEEDQ